jgi:diacylglycerol kinase family enzyme
MDLLGYAVQVARATGEQEDERIQHYHVHRVDIDTKPPMPVMADGLALGEGPLRIRVQQHALAVMVGEPVPAELPTQGLIPKEPTGGSTER